MAKKPKSQRPYGNYRRIKTTVEPIRFSRQLGLIRQLLKDKPRDRLLFIMGTNSGLRMKDLLNLKVRQVKDLASGGVVRIGETRDQKDKRTGYQRGHSQGTHRLLTTGRACG